ncbi:MAG: ABC transporter substrate-binding protein [Thermomicrobiales bacterium]
MLKTRIDELVDQFRDGDLSRRSFVRRATALGLSATAAGALVQRVGAQGATPDASPAASPASGGAAAPINALSKEEYDALIEEEFAWEEPGNTGGQLIYGQTTDISTLNSVLTDDTYSGQIVGLMFETLLGGSVIDGSDVVSGLAESVSVTEDGLTYTVALRQNVFWHDGEQFDADDVIATYDGALSPDSLSPRVATINAVLASYTKIDQFTVQFVALNQVRTFTADALGQFSMLPEHIWGSVPAAEWPTDPGATGVDPARVVGTGPFKFVEWVPSDHVTLVRNDAYWDTTSIPVIDEFIYRIIPEASAAVQALTTGEVDFLESIPPAQAGDLGNNPDLVIESWDTFRFNWYSLNQDPALNTKFVDVQVRQALQYALDRQLLADSVYFGYAIQADGTQPVLSFAYAPDRINTIYNYDPDTARALLEEAGWVDSDGDGIVEKDGQKLSFEVFFSEGVAQYEQQLPYMQQAWREIGVEAFPSAVPFPTLSDSADAGTFDCVVWGFSWDSTGSQDAVFGTDFIPPAGFNVMRYSNPEYDALIPREKQELDREAAREILIEQANIANDDAAAGIVVFRKDINGSRATVHNFFPNGYGLLWSVARTWVEAR